LRTVDIAFLPARRTRADDPPVAATPGVSHGYKDIIDAADCKETAFAIPWAWPFDERPVEDTRREVEINAARAERPFGFVRIVLDSRR
jgi:hypothetical protein